MKPLRLLLLIVVLSMAIAIVQSCDRSPSACFTINVNTDSIHVNQPVTFNGTCSYLADEYFWQFQEANDSTLGSYNSVVTETFSDTGNVSITLTVLKGSQTASTSQTIHVKP